MIPQNLKKLKGDAAFYLTFWNKKGGCVMLDKIRRKILYTIPIELSTEKVYNKIGYIGRICRIGKIK